MGNFYLVCGISGGGKTTLSEKIIEKNPNIKFCDVDKYYELINGDERIRENKFEVWHKVWEDLHKSELAGEDILITTNALSESQRTQFVERLPLFTFHMIWVISPLEKCIEGNNLRPRHIPEDILLKHWNKMEFPNPSEEGWTTITHITNFWELNKYNIIKIKGNIEDYIEI